MKVRFLLLIFLFSVFHFYCGKSVSRDDSNLSDDIKRDSSYNVLLITIDTLRFDRLGVNSDKYVKTPNIDRLAKRSFQFKRAFTHNPITLPSHTNIMTGTTSLYHGISDNSGYILKKRFLTLAEKLKNNGYETGAFVGAYPLDSRFGLDQGFDVYDDNYGTHNALEMFFVERRADKVIEPAVNWISGKTGKWFCWIHLFDPHQPYMPPAPYNEKYSHDLYSGEVAYVDNRLGKLFDYLKKRDDFNKTIIILTADHGEALGEKGEKTHAYFAYNATIHIPLIIKVPGTIPSIILRNVATTDIFPTICDLTRMQTPSYIQGVSLIPLMEGKEFPERYIYFESLAPYLNRGWAPLRGFIKRDEKFIDLPIREFYDLKSDMKEEHNLISKKNGGNLAYELNKLIVKLTNPDREQRADKLDPEAEKKLKSLGYFTGSIKKRKKKFTVKDDLKTLISLQNGMLEALAMYQSGNFRDAISSLKNIISKSPGFLALYSNLANIYKETGRIGDAISIMEKGIKNNPGELSLLSKFGIFLVEANRPLKAVEVLNQCIKLRDYDPEFFNYLGVAYYKSGQFDLALKNYNRALELDKNYASVFNNIGSLYLSMFRKQRDEKSYNMAIEYFNKAIEIDKKLSSAYNGMGAAKYFKNDIDGAIEEWGRAIDSKPDFIDPYFSIGIASLKRGDNENAYRYFLLIKDKFFSKLSLDEKKRLKRLLSESGYQR